MDHCRPFYKSKLSEEQLMSRSCRGGEPKTDPTDKVANPERQSQVVPEKGDVNVSWLPSA